MKKKLTNRLIDTLKPKEKYYKVWDLDLTGLFLRVLPSGTMTYALSYRLNGKANEYNLGRHGSITPTQARELAREKAGELAKGIDVQVAKKTARMEEQRKKFKTLGVFVEDKYQPWVMTAHRDGNKTLKRLTLNFSQWFDKPMDSINAWLVTNWRTGRLNGVGGRKPVCALTVERDVTILHGVLTRAVEWDILDKHPLAGLKPLKTDNNPTVRYLSEDEEQCLRNALDKRQEKHRKKRIRYNTWLIERGLEPLPLMNDRFSDHLAPMVLLNLNTGMRRGELFRLRWDCVDLGRKLLTVEGKGAKSGNTRHIDLNDEALRVLTAWRNQAEGVGLVFPNPKTGKQFGNICSSWKTVRKASGIKKFRFHDLRHTFASNLVMKGASLYVVKELLGHKSIETTQRYAHLSPEHKAEAVALLNRRCGNQ